MKAVHISDQFRSDARKVDWKRVHLSGDRNPPVTLSDRREAVRAAFSAKARRDG